MTETMLLLLAALSAAGTAWYEGYKRGYDSGFQDGAESATPAVLERCYADCQWDISHPAMRQVIYERVCDITPERREEIVDVESDSD